MDEDILEDSHIDEKERMKLNSYNINKEKGIGTLQNFRCLLCHLVQIILRETNMAFYFDKIVDIILNHF